MPVDDGRVEASGTQTGDRTRPKTASKKSKEPDGAPIRAVPEDDDSGRRDRVLYPQHSTTTLKTRGMDQDKDKYTTLTHGTGIEHHQDNTCDHVNRDNESEIPPQGAEVDQRQTVEEPYDKSHSHRPNLEPPLRIPGSETEDPRFKNSAYAAHMAVVRAEHELLDGRGTRFGGLTSIDEFVTLSKQAIKLIDSGSEIHTTCSSEGAIAGSARKVKPIKLQTANGNMYEYDTIAKFRLPRLKIDIEAYIVPGGMEILSTTGLYNKHGIRTRPDPDDPHLLLQDGTKIKLEMIGGLPYLRENRGSMKRIIGKDEATVWTRRKPRMTASAKVSSEVAIFVGRNNILKSCCRMTAGETLGAAVEEEESPIPLEHFGIHYPKRDDCPTCRIAKVRRKPARRVGNSRLGRVRRATRYGYRISMDNVFSKMKSNRGHQFCTTVMDEYTSWTEAYPGRGSPNADWSKRCFDRFRAQDDKVSYHQVRTDNGAEFKGAFERQLESEKILHCKGIPNDPRTEARHESMHRAQNAGVRAMLTQAWLPTTFWPDCIIAYHWIKNRTVKVRDTGVTSYQLRLGRKYEGPTFVFGSEAIYFDQEAEDKFAPTGKRGLLLGRAQGGWAVLDLDHLLRTKKRRVIITQDCKINSRKFPGRELNLKNRTGLGILNEDPDWEGSRKERDIGHTSEGPPARGSYTTEHTAYSSFEEDEGDWAEDTVECSPRGWPGHEGETLEESSPAYVSNDEYYREDNTFVEGADTPCEGAEAPDSDETGGGDVPQPGPSGDGPQDTRQPSIGERGEPRRSPRKTATRSSIGPYLNSGEYIPLTDEENSIWEDTPPGLLYDDLSDNDEERHVPTTDSVTQEGECSSKGGATAFKDTHAYDFGLDEPGEELETTPDVIQAVLRAYATNIQGRNTTHEGKKKQLRRRPYIKAAAAKKIGLSYALGTEAGMQAIIQELAMHAKHGTVDTKHILDKRVAFQTYKDARFVKSSMMMTIKHYEMDEEFHKIKARLVALGDRVLDKDGRLAPEPKDCFDKPIGLVASRATNAKGISSQESKVIYADMDTAYLQAEYTGKHPLFLEIDK